MSNLSLSHVVGTWLLESFEIEDNDKTVSPWGKNTHGLLIYADTGHMSVSINKDIEKDSQNELENIFDSILFYSGTYAMDGNTIHHKVTNASSPTRIGKDMLRHAELQGDLLVLTTLQESFGRAILKWRQFKK